MTELEKLDYEYELERKKQRNKRQLTAEADLKASLNAIELKYKKDERNSIIGAVATFILAVTLILLFSYRPHSQQSCHMGDGSPCVTGPVGGGGGGPF